MSHRLIVNLTAFLISLGALPASAEELQRITTSPASLAPISLDEAVKQALDNNLALKNTRLEIGIAKNKIVSARSHMFPAVRLSAAGLQLLTPLNFSFDKGVFGDFEETGPIPKERTNVSTPEKPVLFVNAFVAQPILQLPKIELAVKQAKLGKVIAFEKMQSQRQQLINQVKRCYYKILELQDSKSVISASMKLHVEIERITAQFLAEKTVLKADSIEVKQQLASAEYEELRLVNSIDAQKEELNHLLGRNLDSDFALCMVSEPANIKLDLPSARAQALKGRAEIRQLRSETKQLDLERRIKRLEYLPQFSVVLDYLSVFGTEVLPRNLVFGGLLMNWEPLDWGRRSSEYQQTSKQLQQSRNSQRDLEERIALEVNNAHRTLQECHKQLSVMKLGQELAQERLRVLANKYAEHATLLRDVLQAEKELTQANHQYAQALLATWTARSDLEKAMGE